MDKNMKYTEALRKMFEVMEGRPDILEITFDRENDSFNVISDTGIHMCFGDEFRNKKCVEADEDITRKIYDAVTNKLIAIGTDLDVNQAIQNVILDFIYK